MLPTKPMFVIAGTGPRAFDPCAHRHLMSCVSAMEEILFTTKVKRTDENVVVVSGGARGFDYWLTAAARSVGVPYFLCLPSPSYADRYWKADLDLFESMVFHAVGVEYASAVPTVELPERATMNLNFARNHRLVNLADAFVAFASESPGTLHCLDVVRRAGLPLRIVGRSGV